MSTKSASSALYYTVVNPGLHTPHQNGSSRCSTWGAFKGSLELHGRTRCKTMTFTQALVFHPCSHSYVNAVYTGWVTFTGWKMGISLRIYSVLSLPLELGVEAAPNYASRTYASETWKHATSIPSHGSLCWQQNPVETASVTRTEKRECCHLRKKWWKMG